MSNIPDIVSISEFKRLMAVAPEKVIAAYFALKKERDELKAKLKQEEADMEATFRAENGG